METTIGSRRFSLGRRAGAALAIGVITIGALGFSTMVITDHMPAFGNDAASPSVWVRPTMTHDQLLAEYQQYNPAEIAAASPESALPSPLLSELLAEYEQYNPEVDQVGALPSSSLSELLAMYERYNPEPGQMSALPTPSLSELLAEYEQYNPDPDGPEAP